MVAAVVEWFLGLAAFLYCFFKTYQKADGRSTRVLAVLMSIFFCLVR
jgi:chitin synthase